MSKCCIVRKNSAIILKVNGHFHWKIKKSPSPGLVKHPITKIWAPTPINCLKRGGEPIRQVLQKFISGVQNSKLVAYSSINRSCFKDQNEVCLVFGPSMRSSISIWSFLGHVASSQTPGLML